jgi:hypothetical protein
MELNELNTQKLSTLVELIRLTRSEEMNCDELLDHVASYADAIAKGHPALPGSEPVHHHLSVCPECLEEFNALVEVLRQQ